MIDVKELRIGNIVCVDNERHHPKLKNIPLEVTSISECIGLDNEKTYSIGLKHINQKPNTYYETYSQFIKFIEPIKLTEDLLLKCGAVIFERNTHVLYNINGISIDKIGNKYIEYVSQIEINGLHELQNIYYWRKKQELEINL